MPPPIHFTRDQVIQAAFDIVEKQGMGVLSARNVAKRLKSSTTPVYSYFNSIDTLKQEVLKQAKEQLVGYIKKPYTDRIFLNICTGIALFARDHRELYHALFLEKNEFEDIVERFLTTMQNVLRNDHRFTTMPVKDRNTMLNKMWIFTHGLATLICVGLIEDDSQAYIANILDEVGTDVIGVSLAASWTRNDQS